MRGSWGTLLLDAKYKDTGLSADVQEIDVPGAGNVRVSRADVYQAIAYREHDEYPQAACGLVFPVAMPAGQPLPQPRTVTGFGEPVHLLFVDVGAAAPANLTASTSASPSSWVSTLASSSAHRLSRRRSGRREDSSTGTHRVLARCGQNGNGNGRRAHRQSSAQRRRRTSTETATPQHKRADWRGERVLLSGRVAPSVREHAVQLAAAPRNQRRRPAQRPADAIGRPRSSTL